MIETSEKPLDLATVKFFLMAYGLPLGAFILGMGLGALFMWHQMHSAIEALNATVKMCLLWP